MYSTERKIYGHLKPGRAPYRGGNANVSSRKCLWIQTNLTFQSKIHSQQLCFTRLHSRVFPVSPSYCTHPTAIRACSLCPFTFLCQLLSTEVRISAGDGKPKCVDGFRLLDLIYQSKTAFCFCLQIIVVLAFWNLSETATDFLMHYTYRIVIGTRPEALLGSPNAFLSPGQTQVCLNRS